MNEVKKHHLLVSGEFTETPGPRYMIEGAYSGELFRNTVLTPKLRQALDECAILVVDLDGTAGYGTSFLEESFGGLIREAGFTYDEVSKSIKLLSTEEPYLLKDIEGYIEEARDA